MATAIILLQFAIVLALIFKGARVGGIGLGIQPLALIAMFPAVNDHHLRVHRCGLPDHTIPVRNEKINYISTIHNGSNATKHAGSRDRKSVV